MRDWIHGYQMKCEWMMPTHRHIQFLVWTVTTRICITFSPNFCFLKHCIRYVKHLDTNLTVNSIAPSFLFQPWWPPHFGNLWLLDVHMQFKKKMKSLYYKSNHVSGIQFPVSNEWSSFNFLFVFLFVSCEMHFEWDFLLYIWTNILSRSEAIWMMKINLT